MFKVGYASDLHFEFHKAEKDWIPDLPTDCDVIILAGDIGVGIGAVAAVRLIARTHPNSQIIYVAGNHEFYKRTIEKQIQQYRDEFADCPNIHFLENDTIVIGGWNFLGCTLWSDFDPLQGQTRSAALSSAQNGIIDFHLIRTDGGERRFTPINAMALHNQSVKWLEEELGSCDPDKTIVVTHFPPSRRARHKKIPENSLTPYFEANCEDLIIRHQPKWWIYGHNHWSERLQIGNTQLLSSQLGYPEELSEIPGLRPDSIIALQ